MAAHHPRCRPAVSRSSPTTWPSRRRRLQVPAGARFGLLFENREVAPHNIRIFDEGTSEPLFVGEVFSGPATRLYGVPALAAGRHSFRCDVHPSMAGEVVAG
jgi:plastocyanin